MRFSPYSDFNFRFSGGNNIMAFIAQSGSFTHVFLDTDSLTFTPISADNNTGYPIIASRAVVANGFAFVTVSPNSRIHAIDSFGRLIKKDIFNSEIFSRKIATDSEGNYYIRTEDGIIKIDKNNLEWQWTAVTSNMPFQDRTHLIHNEVLYFLNNLEIDYILRRNIQDGTFINVIPSNVQKIPVTEMANLPISNRLVVTGLNTTIGSITRNTTIYENIPTSGTVTEASIVTRFSVPEDNRRNIFVFDDLFILYRPLPVQGVTPSFRIYNSDGVIIQSVPQMIGSQRALMYIERSKNNPDLLILNILHGTIKIYNYITSDIVHEFSLSYRPRNIHLSENDEIITEHGGFVRFHDLDGTLLRSVEIPNEIDFEGLTLSQFDFTFHLDK